MAREAARARVLSLFGNTWTGVIGEVETAMQGEGLLAGRASRDLVVRAKAARTEAHRAQVIFDFFSPPNGVRDMWDLVVGMEGKGDAKDSGDNAIVRNDELVQNTLVCPYQIRRLTSVLTLHTAQSTGARARTQCNLCHRRCNRVCEEGRPSDPRGDPIFETWIHRQVL